MLPVNYRWSFTSLKLYGHVNFRTKPMYYRWAYGRAKILNLVNWTEINVINNNLTVLPNSNATVRKGHILQSFTNTDLVSLTLGR